MTERLFRINTHLTTALLLAGLLLVWQRPGWGPGPTLLYGGLILLMLAPVTRVIMATFRYLRARDWLSAGLTIAILVVIALSAWAGAR